ncbi:hypothetical protein LEP1GSC127_3224 [Leptospira kirschneri str. 200801925]|nr:hypothetical protein LEP1GSC127_3224 [Leptospira kirschneri str. 200801925]
MKTITKKNDPKHIAEDEISYYYSLLQEELTEFDCGELCKPDNDGIPFCCIADNAVPTLYASEFSMLKKEPTFGKFGNRKRKSIRRCLQSMILKRLYFVNVKESNFAKETIVLSVVEPFH